MDQVTFMFDNPVSALVNTVLIIGIVLMAVAIPWLNKMTEEQRKRNVALHKENMRLQEGHSQR